jgi:hypothetical protein
MSDFLLPFYRDGPPDVTVLVDELPAVGAVALAVLPSKGLRLGNDQLLT